jgi:hypothetical protein
MEPVKGGKSALLKDSAPRAVWVNSINHHQRDAERR